MTFSLSSSDEKEVTLVINTILLLPSKTFTLPLIDNTEPGGTTLFSCRETEN